MELCRRPGINWKKTWAALVGVGLVHLNRAEVRKLCEIDAELLARAEEHEQRRTSCGSEHLVGNREDGLGRLRASRRGLRPGVAAVGIHGKAVNRSPTAPRRAISASTNRVFSARNLWFLGYPDRALERISISTAIAHESGSKALLGEAHLFASYIYEDRRELDHMQERAEAALAIATELGNVTYRARSEIYLGWAQAMAGDLDGGIARMRHHLSEYRATGTQVYSDYFLALIATAHGPEEAVR